MKKILLCLFAASLPLFVHSCTGDDPSGPGSADFDRQAMLENWADNIIIPAFASFSGQTGQLRTAADAFSAEPTQQTLDDLRQVWGAAYISFQHVSMFEMGRGMELRNYLNIYPACTSESNQGLTPEEKCSPEIRENIEEGSYNLELPSQYDSQGFPALDYLLYGLAESDEDILATYTTGSGAGDYRRYITDLAARMDDLTKEVHSDWEEEYRDDFVRNSGDGATAAVDMMVNDYIFYYEKALRAGKVGIPAGVFSGTPLSSHVEAYYRGDLSRTLLLEALDTVQNFFHGNHFTGGGSGESLKSYLDYLNTIKEGDDLATLIDEQFDAARSEIQTLDDNLALQVENDNAGMLSAYDELQKNVVLMKVDMLQALNIDVDYVDADGD